MRIGKREVSITNLDKIFFPERGLTKGDLIRYYLDVSECLLPHVRRRPMQMLRYPDGVDGFSFYQKRVPNPHPDWLELVGQRPNVVGGVLVPVGDQAPTAHLPVHPLRFEVAEVLVLGSPNDRLRPQPLH